MKIALRFTSYPAEEDEERIIDWDFPFLPRQYEHFRLEEIINEEFPFGLFYMIDYIEWEKNELGIMPVINLVHELQPKTESFNGDNNTW